MNSETTRTITTVPRIDGQVVVITGASDGIGKAASRALKALGANLVIVGRSPEKTRAVATELNADSYISDFADFSQVRRLAEQLSEAYPRIDVLINNAGFIARERTLTVDGHEQTLQVNHLSPFLLTNSLHGSLAAGHGRVITTSSLGNLGGHFRRDDLDYERGWSSWGAYCDSKLYNVLFTKELARRWLGDGISAATLHPGLIASNFGHGASHSFDLLRALPFGDLILRSPEHGADTMVWLAATVPGRDWLTGGHYSSRRPGRLNPLAGNEPVARTLWDRSEALVGLSS